MSQFIIGFTGKIGVGKTTVSTLLCQILNSFGYRAGLASFGDGLRMSVARNLHIPVGVVYDHSLKSKPLEVIPGYEEFMPYIEGCSATAHLTPKSLLREVLQEYSQNGARLRDPDVWVNALHERLELLPHEIIIIDDIRQKNELEYCKERGVVFRITPYKEYEDHPASSHPVESAIDNEVAGINLLEIDKFGTEYTIRAAQRVASYLMNFFKEQEFETVFQRLHHEGEK